MTLHLPAAHSDRQHRRHHRRRTPQPSLFCSSTATATSAAATNAAVSRDPVWPSRNVPPADRVENRCERKGQHVCQPLLCLR